MFRLAFRRFLALVLAAGCFVPHTALAVPITFAGELSESDAYFNRPVSATALSVLGTHMPYDVIGFRVSADGRYSVEATAFTGRRADTYLALYQDSFNAARPLDRLLQVNDDGGVGYLSAMNRALQANTRYLLVLTSFTNGSFGAYTGRFETLSGAGQVILDGSEVPEPGTLALLPLAAVGLALARRRRRG